MTLPKKKLITTAYFPSWKIENDEEIVFLGEWCKPNGMKQYWENLRYSVLPYHWADRTKLHKDCAYIYDVVDRLIGIYREKLNSLHEVKGSVRYWRIILSPWLLYVVSILYNYYSSLLLARAHSGEGLYTLVSSKMDVMDFVPDNTLSSVNWLCGDEREDYKYHVFSELLRKVNGIEIIEVDESPVIPKHDHVGLLGNLKKYFAMARAGLKTKFKSSVFAMLELFSSKHGKIVFTLDRAYFSFKHLIYFMYRLRGRISFLNTYQNDHDSYNQSIDKLARKDLVVGGYDDEFLNICGSILPKIMPKSFVESFKTLEGIANNKHPKKPKFILSAISHWYDEIFKIYVAKHVDMGAKFSIVQHGGFYAVAKDVVADQSEFNFSDKFYSWGWRKKGFNNIVPMPGNKMMAIKNKLKVKPRGGALICALNLPRYSGILCSIPSGLLLYKHYDHLRLLIRNLPQNIQEKTNVRISNVVPLHELNDRVKSWGYPVSVTDTRKKLYRAINGSRLVISNYNSTVFLETMAENFPTVIFYDPKYMEHSDEAVPYFEMLKEVGIFHSDPEEAANHINKIFDDPMAWWMREDVQRAKNKFCHQYAYVGKAPIQEWVSELKSQLEN